MGRPQFFFFYCTLEIVTNIIFIQKCKQKLILTNFDEIAKLTYLYFIRLRPLFKIAQAIQHMFISY